MGVKVGTIRQIRQQLVQDGYQISEYALRQWVKDGSLPSVRSGKKFFIAYAHVVELLTTGGVVLTPA